MAFLHLKREILLKIVQEGYFLTLSLTLSALLVLFGYIIGISIAPRVRGEAVQSVQSLISPRDLSGFEQEVFDLINGERDDRHLPVLEKDGDLQKIAGERVGYLFTTGQFDHGDFEGFVRERGYCFKVLGENLAKGYKDAGDLVDGWLESESHREVMLNKNYTRGAVAQNGDYAVFLFSHLCD